MVIRRKEKNKTARIKSNVPVGPHAFTERGVLHAQKRPRHERILRRGARRPYGPVGGHENRSRRVSKPRRQKVEVSI